MLEELRIANFAIIDFIELNFDPGLNVITGETGAGKSIILDSIELLMGGKADSSSVRAGAEKAVIEGIFALDERARARILPILAQEDLIGSEGYDSAGSIILTREVRANGRSNGRVNGVTVSSEVLREIGQALIDIHGQSAHLSLFRPRAHLELLDRYANLSEARESLAAIVHKLSSLRADIAELLADKAELQRRADRLREALEDISGAELAENEEMTLMAERNRLANSEQLATLSAAALNLLMGDESRNLPSAADQLAEVSVLLAKLARIDPAMSAAADNAAELSDELDDLTRRLSRYVDDVEYNPQRLNELEARLEKIKALKRRYQKDSIGELLAYAEACQAELDKIENSETRLEELRADEDKILRQIGILADHISQVRQAAARKMAQQVEAELADLRMERARFQVQILRQEAEDGCITADGKRYAFSASGIDQVEFLMSANPGEPLRPLAKVASGGEAARIMLSLKRVLTLADETPTLIFDEIDQGIGGRIGTVVGEKLWSLTQGHQVMVVTHLPQLAAYADKHFHVQKVAKGERTATRVSLLDEDALRVSELAAMLGAEGESGTMSARDLLLLAENRKRELMSHISS
ncbi:MAG: DNA repair protein RecN [Anaerolineae bacterium]|nr:DNA repair protein RecN [Anaerolineae bacterium]